jgi:hypothetical protein
VREQRIEEQGSKVVELFTQCTAAPDDLEVAAAADEALQQLEDLLTDEAATLRVNGLGSTN